MVNNLVTPVRKEGEKRRTKRTQHGQKKEKCYVVRAVKEPVTDKEQNVKGHETRKGGYMDELKRSI